MFVHDDVRGSSPLANIETHLPFFSSSGTEYGYHRLLYLVGQLQPGGLERQLYCLLQEMDRECYKPVVVVWDFCKDDYYVDAIHTLDIPIYFFSKGASRGVKLKAFRALLRQLNPELVHSYSFFTNFAAQWAAWGTRTIPIGSVRSDFLWAKKESGLLLGRLSARWPRVQIYNSHNAAKHAQESKCVFRPKKIFVVPNGLDVKRFAGMAETIPDESIILGVGSLYPVKRWDRLLNAAAEIKRKGMKYKIIIAGDGPLRPILQQQTDDLGIASCVEFLGHRKDISSLINNARFLVHTADTEGYPNVVMEAMACGRPVVAMDAGDIPCLVDDGKTGFVVRQGDQVRLVQCIFELLQNYPLCVNMGNAAREKAECEFGVEPFVRRTMEAYRGAGWIF
jgi:glycosyltransferase involved in cell wall biosynthesis